MTGLQVLQALIDGKLPAPPIAQTLSFWLVEVGDGLAFSKPTQECICSTLWEVCMAAGR